MRVFPGYNCNVHGLFLLSQFPGRNYPSNESTVEELIKPVICLQLVCDRCISIAIPRFEIRFVCETVLEYFNRGDLGLHLQYLLPARGQNSEQERNYRTAAAFYKIVFHDSP